MSASAPCGQTHHARTQAFADLKNVATYPPLTVTLVCTRPSQQNRGDRCDPRVLLFSAGHLRCETEQFSAHLGIWLETRTYNVSPPRKFISARGFLVHLGVREYFSCSVGVNRNNDAERDWIQVQSMRIQRCFRGHLCFSRRFVTCQSCKSIYF